MFNYLKCFFFHGRYQSSGNLDHNGVYCWKCQKWLHQSEDTNEQSICD